MLRQALYVAVTPRAVDGSCWPTRAPTDRGSGLAPCAGGGGVPSGGRRRVGGPRGGAVRARRDAALDLPAAARRAARGHHAGRRSARRAAVRHRPGRLPRRRPLPRAAEGGGADRAARRARAWPRRCGTSTRASSRRSPPSSGRSSPPRRSTTTCSTPSGTRAGAPRRSPRATSRRSSRSCPGAATAWCCRPRTSTPTGRAR